MKDKTGKDESKSTICFSTTKELHAKLKEAAKQDERSLSKFIHLILKKAVK